MFSKRYRNTGPEQTPKKTDTTRVVLQRKCACGNHTRGGGECEACAKGHEQVLQRKSDSHERERKAPPIVHEVLSSPGHPLDSETRSVFEPRFGADFSRVRVHADENAAASAKAVDAIAYTVGQDVVFGSGQFQPTMSRGQELLAHELTHTLQQPGSPAPARGSLKIGEHDAFEQEADLMANKSGAKQKPDSATKLTTAGLLQRTPAVPTEAGKPVPFDSGKVNISVIPDVLTLANPGGSRIVVPQSVSVTISDPKITHLVWEVYSPTDKVLPGGYGTTAGRAGALGPFTIENGSGTTWAPVQGKHVLRCTGYDNANKPVAYADRNFYLWTSTPTANYAGMVAEKTKLEAITKAGSGKSFGEVASGFTKLRDVKHDLAVLETGTGLYEGTKCAVKTAGAITTDCTDIVQKVLKATFTQQGRAADWAKVEKKYAENTKVRGAVPKDFSGVDIQAALQSECGWKGIFWAPDPKYLIPKAELVGPGIKSEEASFTAGIAKRKGTYYKNFGTTTGYPGVSVDQLVTNYAPEAPYVGHGDASKTTKDTTQLDKLKKLKFGVLSAHGGYHMTIISSGKVIEVHWDKDATDVNLIQQTDLDKWAVGSVSGFHYYASGVIVAPASDVDAAFK